MQLATPSWPKANKSYDCQLAAVNTVGSLLFQAPILSSGSYRACSLWQKSQINSNQSSKDFFLCCVFSHPRLMSSWAERNFHIHFHKCYNQSRLRAASSLLLFSSALLAILSKWTLFSYCYFINLLNSSFC